MFRSFASRFLACALLSAASTRSSAQTPPEPLVGTLPVDVSVDNKGAANATIPLQIPPGRGGMQPKLALVYNSQAGNGPLGIGWSISTGFPQSITRGRSILARDGVTRGVNFDANDKLYLDGKRLICVSGTYGAPGSTYRTEVDSFVTITATGSGTNIDTFVITDKSGTKMTFGLYGASTDAYQRGGEYSNTHTGLAYAYALKRIEDTLGNYIMFSYLNPISPEPSNVPRQGGEYLLSEINYTGGTGIAPSTSIVLSYTDGRPDKNYSYTGGRSFPITKLLNKIEIFRSLASVTQTSASYILDYDDAQGAGNSRLITVRPILVQPEDPAEHATPATTIQWADGTVSYTSIGLPLSHQGSPSLFGDVNGDGRDDMINCGSGIYVAKSTGSGFSDWEVWSIYGGSLPKLCDINGDGLKDIVFGNVPYPGSGGLSALISNGSKFVCLNGEDTAPASFHDLYPDFQDPRTGNSYFISVELESITNRICTADFNGDGRDDILIHRYDGKIKVIYSYGTGFHNAVEYNIQSGGLWAIPNYAIGNYNFLGWLVGPHPSISQSPCDLNGDGRADYVWTENKQEWFASNTSAVSPMTVSMFAITSLPEGGFSSKEGIADYWYAPASYNWGKFRQSAFGALQGDINGDGLTDFLVIKPESLRPSDMDPDGWQQAEIEFYLKLSQGGSGAARFHTIDLSGNNAHEFTVNVGGETMVPIFDRMTHGDFVSALAFDPGSVDSPETIEMWRVAARLSSFENMSLEDINGDGKADYVWYVHRPRNWEWEPDISGWYVMYSLGASFSAPQRLNNGWPAAEPINIYGDAGAGHYMHTRQSADINGDGIADTVTLWESHRFRQGVTDVTLRSSGGRGDLVESITDGVGRKTEIAYKAAKDASLYTRGAPVSYPIREVMASTPVVSDIYKDAGSSSAADRAHYSYQYSGNRLDLSGRGGLGFHSFVTLDHQTNLFKYQFLTQSFPMTGLTAREQTYRYWGASGQTHFRLLTSHDNVIVFDEVVDPANSSPWGTVYPYMSQATEARWENTDSAHFNLTPATASAQPEIVFSKLRPANPHIAITAKSWFDNQSLTAEPQTGIPSYYASDTLYTGSDYQNIVTGIANYSDFDALEFPGKITHGNLRQLTTDFGDGFTEKVVSTYHSPTTNGLTGLVDTVTTTVSSATHGTETAPVKAYTYWTSGATPTPLVATESVNATDDSLDLTTTYTRDALGRVTETAISGFNSPGDLRHIGTYTVSKNTAFDARFDLPTVSENAYGHPTTTVYHPFFGTPTSTTDVNGAEKTSAYDALGRVTQARDVLKNLQTDTAYAWTTADATDWKKTQTVSPPSGVTGLSLSSRYAIRSTATVQPAVTTYYDRLGRAIRTVKDGFAGQQTITDTIYNTLGQTVASSLPYKSGTTPLWTTTTYDPLGRVVTVTAPNGTVTTSTYNGRLTAVTVDATDRDPQTNTTYVDAKGRTIKVWNADNTPASPDPVTGSTTPASIFFKLDGFGRMRETLLRDQTQTITATYDALGRQTALNDPDKGNWTYVNNALGQVVQQTDAKLNVTRSTFDPLGRPLTRTTTEPASGPVETANWYYYDTTANVSAARHTVALGEKGWIGAPQREDAQTTGAPGYTAAPTQKIYYYDDKGRPSISLSSVDNKWFYTHTAYDAYSRVASTRHYWRPPAHELPSDQPYVWQDFGYTYAYDGTGASSKSYLVTMGDTAGRTWWQADSANGYDHLDRPVLVRKGSGHWTQRTYKPEDGTLTALKTGPTAGATDIQDLAFSYDGLGNLSSRTAPSLSETFSYDSLNRLTNSSISGTTTYLNNGNIKTKTDINGNTSAPYIYYTARPHAVSNAFGFIMMYDANGNLTLRSGNGKTNAARWTGFSKPRWMYRTAPGGIRTGSEFTYDANRSRVLHLEFDALSGGAPAHYTRKKIYGLGPTLEVDYKNTAASGPPAWQMDKVRIYVPGPEGTAGTMEYSPFAPSDQDERPLVYHYDHLGSIETITPYGSTATSPALDDAGRTSRFAYDAWGERRNAATWSGAPTETSHGGHESLTPRGYTGHEMLDGLDLVHMNGRIYDPLLGRMLSADTLVQNPGSLQDFNRYSYVKNSPLTLTDPTGFTYQLYQEQAQFNLRLHARELGVERQFDDARTKAGVSITAGFVATVATAGAAPAVLGETIVGRILIAEVSGAVGGATSNMTDNAMNGRPITENNSIAITVGALGGMAGQVLDEAATAAMRSSAASTATTTGAAQADGPNPAIVPVSQAKPTTPAPTETGTVPIYHRFDTPENIGAMVKTGTLSGRPPTHTLQSDIPAAQAHPGPAPAGATGVVEFTTPVSPNAGSVPGGGTFSGVSWSGTTTTGRPGVTVVPYESATIPITVLRVVPPPPPPPPPLTPPPLLQRPNG